MNPVSLFFAILWVALGLVIFATWGDHDETALTPCKTVSQKVVVTLLCGPAVWVIFLILLIALLVQRGWMVVWNLLGKLP